MDAVIAPVFAKRMVSNYDVGVKRTFKRVPGEKAQKYDRIKENTDGVFSCHTEQIPVHYSTAVFV